MTLNIDLIDQIVAMTDEVTGGDFDKDRLVDDLTQMTRPELEVLIENMTDEIRTLLEDEEYCDCL